MLLTRWADRIGAWRFYVLGYQVPTRIALPAILLLLTYVGLNHWVNRNNWSLLVHEQYGFAVEYPTNWKTNTYGENGLRNRRDLKAILNTHQLGSVGLKTKGLDVYWESLTNPFISVTPDQRFEQYIQRNTQAGTSSDFVERTIGIGKYPALMRTFRGRNDSKVYYQYFVRDGVSVYLLEFYLRHEEREAQAEIDHMLNSFRIVDYGLERNRE